LSPLAQQQAGSESRDQAEYDNHRQPEPQRLPEPFSVEQREMNLAFFKGFCSSIAPSRA
jgi:hypothetical protein